MTQKNERLQVIEKLVPKQRSNLVILLILVAILIGGFRSIVSGDIDLAGLADNFSIELIGAALTFWIFDLFQERRNELQLKKRLISQIRSGDKRRAQHAIEELRLEGWLCDGSLQSEFFRKVSLKKGIDLRCANLANTDWRGAKMIEVRLQGANLSKAKLQGANLLDAKFDKSTTLPDGTMWKSETDMTRFTDPKHPDFWQNPDDKPDESTNMRGCGKT